MLNSTSLSSNNFTYVKMNVQGTSTIKYFLSCGGYKKSTLVNDAKQSLLASNPLQKNQALANITVNWKKTYILSVFYTVVKCIVTADIVEFHSPENNENSVVNSQEPKTSIISSDQPKTKITQINKTESTIKIGDKVRYKDTFKQVDGVVCKINGNSYTIKYVNERGVEKEITTSSAWFKKIN